MVTVGVTELYTLIVVVALVTEAGVAQAALLLSTHVTISPFEKLLLEYVGLKPTGLPLTYQVYVGEGPPLVAVAV